METKKIPIEIFLDGYVKEIVEITPYYDREDKKLLIKYFTFDGNKYVLKHVFKDIHNPMVNDVIYKDTARGCELYRTQPPHSFKRA